MTRQDNQKAALHMLGAVMMLALIPLCISAGGGDKSPFLFNATWRIGLGVGYIAFLFMNYRDLLFRKDIWRLTLRRIPSWPMAFLILNSFQIAAFAWSTSIVDIAVTAVLFELWPIMYIFLATWLFRNERYYHPTSVALVSFLIMAFAGAALVITSQSGDLAKMNYQSIVPGSIIAIGAALLSAFAAFGIKWGMDLADAIEDETLEQHDDERLAVFGVVTAICLVTFISIPVNVSLGAIQGESFSSVFGWGLVASLLGGCVVHTIGDINWRRANILTRNLGINSMGYLVPLGAIIFLWLFNKTSVASIEHLVAGTVLIMLANGAISLDRMRPVYELEYGNHGALHNHGKNTYPR